MSVSVGLAECTKSLYRLVVSHLRLGYRVLGYLPRYLPQLGLGYLGPLGPVQNWCHLLDLDRSDQSTPVVMRTRCRCPQQNHQSR